MCFIIDHLRPGRRGGLFCRPLRVSVSGSTRPGVLPRSIGKVSSSPMAPAVASMLLPDEAAPGEGIQVEEVPGGGSASAGGGPAGVGWRIVTAVSRPSGCRPWVRPGPASRSSTISTLGPYSLARARRFRSTVPGYLCQSGLKESPVSRRGWVNSCACGAALGGIDMQSGAQMELRASGRAHFPCSRPSPRDFKSASQPSKLSHYLAPPVHSPEGCTLSRGPWLCQGQSRIV